jgi:uncharacterized protein Yka (UPF0111/DUF47 family)
VRVGQGTAGTVSRRARLPVAHRQNLVTVRRVKLRITPRASGFFPLFCEAGDNAAATARLVERRFADVASVAQREVKQLENVGDETTRRIIELLNTQYLTPFDREDILALASALDDVVDNLEEASDLLALYHVTSVRPRALEQCGILVQACEGLAAATACLATRSGVQRHINAVRDLEDVGDAAVRAAIAGLFEEDVETRDLIRWKDIHEALEEALDAADRAANVMGNIVVKNA